VIDDGIDATLATLYSSVPGSREVAGKALGILVFPKTYAAGLVVGGEHGRGALQIEGRTVGYYATSGISFGLQAGAESRGLVFMFMTRDALARFQAGDGWTAGVDARVAAAKSGANGSVDFTNPKADVAAFALTNQGLMVAADLESTKVRKLALQ
jgi:lipid-binding SYLF domain-containing protein